MDIVGYNFRDNEEMEEYFENILKRKTNQQNDNNNKNNNNNEKEFDIYSYLFNKFDLLINFLGISLSSFTPYENINQNNFQFLFFQSKIHIWKGDIFQLPKIFFSSSSLFQSNLKKMPKEILQKFNFHQIINDHRDLDDELDQSIDDAIKIIPTNEEIENSINFSNYSLSLYRKFDRIFIDFKTAETNGLVNILPLFLPLLKTEKSKLEIEFSEEILTEKNSKSENLLINSLFGTQLYSSQVYKLLSCKCEGFRSSDKNFLIHFSRYSFDSKKLINELENENEEEKNEFVKDFIHFFDFCLFGERENIFNNQSLSHLIPTTTTYSFLYFFSYISHNFSSLLVDIISKILKEMAKSNTIYKISFSMLLHSLYLIPSLSPLFKKLFNSQISIPVSSLKNYYGKIKWRSPQSSTLFSPSSSSSSSSSTSISSSLSSFSSSSYILICLMYFDYFHNISNYRGIDLLNWINQMDGNHMQIVDHLLIDPMLNLVSFSFPEFLMEDGAGERPKFYLIDISNYSFASSEILPLPSFF